MRLPQRELRAVRLSWTAIEKADAAMLGASLQHVSSAGLNALQPALDSEHGCAAFLQQKIFLAT